MNFKNILNLFSDINPGKLIEMKSVNNGNFLKSIQDNDLKSVKKSLELGLNANSTSFWKDLYNMGSYDINETIYDFLLNGKFHSVEVDSDVVKNVSTELRVLLGGNKKINEKTFTSSFIIREIFKDKIIKNLISDKTPFNENLFFMAVDNINYSTICKNTNTLVKKIGQSDISIYSDKLHKYITSHNRVGQLLNSIDNIKSLNTFMNSNHYSAYFKHASEDNKVGMMDYALAKGQIEKVKALHKLGLSFSNCSKGSYSELFMMTNPEGHETQNYVVANIEDVTIGKNVILKTLLHFKDRTVDHIKKMELINQILDKYPNDKLELIPEVLAKREDTLRVLFVKRYYDHKMLKHELTGFLTNQDPVKKLKI